MVHDVAFVVVIEKKVFSITPFIATSEQGNHEPPFFRELTPVSRMQRSGEKAKSNHAKVITSSKYLSITGPCHTSCRSNETAQDRTRPDAEYPEEKQENPKTGQIGSPAGV